MKAVNTLVTLTLAALAQLGAQRVTQSGSTPASPEARVATDPQALRSLSNAAARPVPIDNLYFTRNVFGAAWAPNGHEIAFTADIAGRFKPWKVSAAGGWPVQLTQSDEIQAGAVWSPDGKWI